MTLRHFEIFLTVCDTLNMTTAAESIFISQSAISQAIAELEKYYDVRLFERLSRRLYLTQAGEKLQSYARHMVRMNADIEKEMKAHSGSLRIGASVTVGTNVLPPLVIAFAQKCPDTKIEVFEDNTKQVENLLLSDTIDIGLVEGDVTSPYITRIPFMDDELVLICGRHHRFASLPVVQPHDLEQEDFIIRELGSGTRKTFEGVMTAHQISWNMAWTCSNADTIKAAVAAGLGVSVISRMAVTKEAEAGELCVKPIEGIRFDRKIKIAHHKNKFLNEQMKKLIDLCVERSLSE